MANATPSRLGFTNNTSDGTFAQDNAQFMVEFTGLVMNQFETVCVTKDLFESRSIQSGKSAQFHAIGRTTASYHTPGAELTGNAINQAIRTINVDNLLTAEVSIDTLDEAKLHFEVRSKFAREIANALAFALDKNLLQLAVLAARASTTVTGGNGGSVIVNANFRNSGEDLVEGIFTAAQKLDEKDVPAEDRYVVVRPEQYYKLVQSPKAIHTDIGGQGSISEGKVVMIAGITVIKSNHLPITNISAVTGAQNTYHGDFSNTAAVVFHREAVGLVKLKDLEAETWWNPDKQCTFLLGKYALGAGILRPECSVELSIA